MKIFLLLNKNAGSYENAQPLLESLKDDARVTIVHGECEDDVPRLTYRAISQGYDVICPGGGDGTIHSIVNSLARDDLGKIGFGLLPLGTGNDFCRSFGIPNDPLEAFALITDPQRAIEQRIDLIEVSSARQRRYCVNLASGGFGGEVEKHLDPELKARWRTLAYARAAVRAFSDLKEFSVRASFDAGPLVELSTLSIIVANGIAAGGGFEVAPHADPADRRIDIVITHTAPALQLASIAAQLLVGDYTQSEHVSHLRAKKLHIQSEPPMDFSVDGSFVEQTPLAFSVLPGVLRIIRPKENTPAAVPS